MLPFIQTLLVEFKGIDCMNFDWIDHKGIIFKLGMITSAQDLCSVFEKVCHCELDMFVHFLYSLYF